jgi:two-component system, LytTR family, response regulator
VTIRALIVDDEPLARRGLARHLVAEGDVEVVGECGDGASAVAAIGELAPDLVFLDVEMPEVDGFDVVRAVGAGAMPAVIFVTAFDQYAVRAFDVHALDYVLKPIDVARFRVAVARARERLARPEANDLAARIAAALADIGRAAPPTFAKRLAVKSDGRVTLVDVGDVDRIEAAGNYVEIVAAGKRHLMRETMASLEARLDPERFVRVSRSAIVNADRVRELRPMFNGDVVVVLRDGTEVSAGRRYRQNLDALTR